jgi:ribosome-binding factor A
VTGGREWVRDQQLAKIVRNELSMIMGSASDERLGMIEVLSVEPKHGGSGFLVVYGPPTITPEEVPEIVDRTDAQRIIDNANGFLRSELVQAMNVKNAVDISFTPSPVAWEEWERVSRYGDAGS